MKNLPRVFANPINKVINNNKEIYLSTEKNKNIDVMDNIPQKINEIFASPHHVYKSKVKIKTDKEEIETDIVGETANDLLTLNGDKIRIKDINFIKRI